MGRAVLSFFGLLTSGVMLVLLPISQARVATQAQTIPAAKQKVSSETRRAVAFARSTVARNLKVTQPINPGPDRDRPRVRLIPKREAAKHSAEKTEDLDTARQMVVAEPKMPAAIVSFEGISNDDNLAAFGSRINPPDANGDVGPNHYVQQTNLLVRVFSKAGVPLTAAFKLSALFAPVGGLCASDDGDPIVLYDALADRWVLSQLAYTSVHTPPYHECIAISQTPDPTGGYFLYDFQLPGTNFPDYPKLAVWPDAYYMTSVQFNFGGLYNGAGAFAFQRENMLAGDPTAALIYFSLDLASYPEGIAGLLPADHDGIAPPPAGAPNPMAYFVATEFADALDGLRVFDFHADFTAPAASTFIERPGSPLPVVAFNPVSPAGQNDIPQPPPAVAFEKLDAISDRLMHRLQYRNRGGFESLVVNHTVDADPGVGFHAGIRWYELRNGTFGGAYSVHDQATFAPDAVHRWMGSAAVDNTGNLVVGYSASSDTVFPSIRYAGRLATDPAGGLFQGEATLIDGTGVQASATGRWGDYTGLTVDETDGCAFWYTNQYYTAASAASSPIGWRTRVGVFKFPGCTPPPAGTLTVNVTSCTTGSPLAGASVRLEGVLYGMTNDAGSFVARAGPGSYTVQTTKGGSVESAAATIVDGGSSVLEICLTAVPSDLSIALRGLLKAGAGDAIDIKYTLSNLGTGAAGSTTTALHLSADTTLDASDVLLGTKASGPVPAGEEVTDSMTVTIPPSTAAAKYFIIAQADSLNAEAETNEGNNTAAKEISVGPDLMILALSAPSSAAAGSDITIDETTKNNGGDSAKPSTTTYYLSKNRKLDAGDIVLGAHEVRRLRPTRTDSAATSVTIPSAIAPGDYYILAIADDGSVISEYNERNNDKWVGITIGPLVPWSLSP
jgi:hypothetical protein